MKRRILSMILALAMIASLFTGLSFTASAVDAPASGEYVIAANVNGTYYAMSATFGSKINSKVVTVTNGMVSAADAEGYTLTLTSTADGYTISNGETYLAYNSNANFKTVTTLENAAYWTVSDGTLGTYRFANAATVARGVVFRASTYNLFGAYAVSNVTENGTEYYDLELLTVDTGSVWTWDGNEGQNGYHTEVNQNNETRQVACTPDSTGVINPAPTCVDTGIETFLCTVCGGVASTVVLPTVAHNYVNGVCSVCGALEPQLDTYVLASSLREGDKIMFVDETGAKAAGELGGSGTSTFLTAVDAVITDDTVTSADALIFDVEAGVASGTFAFKSGDYYLTASPAASSNNYLYLTETEKSADTDWTVTFADGLADVSYCSSAAANGRHLRYNVNNTNPRFSGYTSSSTSIRNPSIYKLSTGEDLVDVYFVDQNDNVNAYAYAFGAGVENAAFPGQQLTAQGVDENGDNYYKITLDRNVYTNVIFSGGSNATQTANLGLGSAGYIVYYVYQDNGVQASVGDDVWPGPGVVTPPSCTEPGCTTYTGLLTGVTHVTDETPATGHVWGAWTFNGDNTHTRTCTNDATHTETGYCADANEDGLCDVCGGAMVEITGLVADGEYVIAAKVGDDYYALPAALGVSNPDGEAITVTDGAVAADDAEGYIFTLAMLPNGNYTISNGSVYLGSYSSGTGIRTLSANEDITDNFRWTIDNGAAGTYRVANVAVPTRALAYQDNQSNPDATQIFTRFGVYAVSNLTGEGYFFDLELLPVSEEIDDDSPEDIDVYFVDEMACAEAYAYFFDINAPEPDPDDTEEDLQYPGNRLQAKGVEKGGFNYYKITLNTGSETHVIFNNGLTGGVQSGNQTVNLDFAADANPDPLNPDGNAFVVYYIHQEGGLMTASTGSDVWPAPPVVQEPTCTEDGWSHYVGLRTGVYAEETTLSALGHDWGEWTESTAPTCTADGEETRTCARCGEIERRPVDALGHLPGEAVQENYVEPTATAEGGYDTVVYCQRCNAELSREHTTLPATGPVEPIVLNSLRVFRNVSIGTDMLITFSILESNLTTYDSWYIQITKDGLEGTETYLYGPEACSLANGTYAVDFTYITAKEMGVMYHAQVFAEKDGVAYCGPVREGSMKQYLASTLTSTDSSVSATLKTLAADMLNYGAAAQVFLNYDTEHLVNVELSETDLTALHNYETTGEASATKTNTNTVPTGEPRLLYTSVAMTNRVELGLFVNLNNLSGWQDAESIEVQMKDHETQQVVAVLPTVLNANGTQMDATFPGIGARNMRTEYDFVTLVDGVERGNIRTWSVEGYVNQLRNDSSSSDALKALANAVLIYGDSAQAYLDTQTH